LLLFLQLSFCLYFSIIPFSFLSTSFSLFPSFTPPFWSTFSFFFFPPSSFLLLFLWPSFSQLVQRQQPLHSSFPTLCRYFTYIYITHTTYRQTIPLPIPTLSLDFTSNVICTTHSIFHSYHLSSYGITSHDFHVVVYSLNTVQAIHDMVKFGQPYCTALQVKLSYSIGFSFQFC